MSLFSNDIRVAYTATPSFNTQTNVEQYGWAGVDVRLKKAKAELDRLLTSAK